MPVVAGPLRAFLCLAAEKAPTADAANLPIVDTHQHLWDLAKLRLSWLDNAGALNRSYTLEHYRQAIQGLNVVKAVYMEVAVDPAQLSRRGRSSFWKSAGREAAPPAPP